MTTWKLFKRDLDVRYQFRITSNRFRSVKFSIPKSSPDVLEPTEENEENDGRNAENDGENEGNGAVNEENMLILLLRRTECVVEGDDSQIIMDTKCVIDKIPKESGGELFGRNVRLSAAFTALKSIVKVVAKKESLEKCVDLLNVFRDVLKAVITGFGGDPEKLSRRGLEMLKKVSLHLRLHLPDWVRRRRHDDSSTEVNGIGSMS